MRQSASRTCTGCGDKGRARIGLVRLRRSSSCQSPGGWYGRTDGPPIRSTSSPLAARAWSRIISADSRIRGPRPSSRFSGSRSICCRVALRRLPVRGAGHDQAVEALDVPTAADELGGQPVEQFRMAGRGLPATEVFGRPHEPRAEEHLPVAVDRHASRERVGRIDQPAGKSQPVWLRGVRRHGGKTGRHSGGDP